MSKSRLFIAFELPNDIKDYLYSSISNDLRKTDVRASHVHRDNMHITVKFLGDTDDDGIIDIMNLIDGVASGNGLFECYLGGVGTFGGRYPRVVHVETIVDEAHRMTELVHEINQHLTHYGFEPESKKFVPHITLCRIRDPRNAQPIKEIADNYKLNRLPFILTKVALMKSTLTPHGAIYERLHESKLI